MQFVTVEQVRDYLQADDTTGQWSAGNIGSNINVASANLQRWTGRQFEAGSNTQTRVFSSFGRSVVTIPDARTVIAVRLNDSALTDGETFHAIPDRMNSGVYTAISLPGYEGRRDYRSFPDWFDRNLDSWRWQGNLQRGTPNDLEVDALWGPSAVPDEVMHATKVLAGWYTLRSDALLSNAVNRLDQGVIFDMSRLPVEVQEFVSSWKLGDAVVSA